MKTAILAFSCFALVLAVTSGTAVGQSADAPEAVIYDAQSAMEVLKTLSGDWVRETTDSEHGTNTPVATFELTAAGSARSSRRQARARP